MPTPNFRLDGSVAFVTGAAGGIGAAVARGLAESGADVACADRSAEILEPTFRAIEATGKRAIVCPLDVTDASALSEAVARTEREFGPLAHAVNCAGINDGAPAESMAEEQWRRLLDINLTGVFLACQAEGAALITNGGAAS